MEWQLRAATLRRPENPLGARWRQHGRRRWPRACFRVESGARCVRWCCDLGAPRTTRLASERARARAGETDERTRSSIGFPHVQLTGVSSHAVLAREERPQSPDRRRARGQQPVRMRAQPAATSVRRWPMVRRGVFSGPRMASLDVGRSRAPPLPQSATECNTANGAAWKGGAKLCPDVVPVACDTYLLCTIWDAACV